MTTTDIDDLMMSPELEGQIPDVDDQIAALEGSMPLCVLELDLGTGDPDDDLVMGTLVGISFGPAIEIDMRLPTPEAFRICSKWLSGGVMECSAYHFNHGEQENRQVGPWYVHRTRMTDFDTAQKTCTLGVDLKYLNPQT